MGRRKNFITFDAFKFKIDLEKALKGAVQEASSLLYETIMYNLTMTPFKDNPVKTLRSVSDKRSANTITTSDAERKQAVIASVINKGITSMSTSIISAKVSYTALNFKDSHIGIYYEHGIGGNWDGTNVRVTAEGMVGNKFREGSQVVSRSKHINYQGMGKGVWVDLGGNLRITGSNRAGQKDSGFMDYIGEETLAYHWFSSALKEKKDRIIGILRKAVNSVNPISKKYIKIQPVYVLGKD